MAIRTSVGGAVDGGGLVLLLFGIVTVLAVAVFVLSFAGTPRREKVGYAAGFLVAVVLNGLLDSLPGDRGDGPWLFASVVLTTAVAVDVARQVPLVRPASLQGAVAVAAWGVGTFFLAPIVLGVYVARRIMRLPVIRRRQPVSPARSRGRSGAASAASTAVVRPKND
jgi:hypothetical protein